MKYDRRYDCLLFDQKGVLDHVVVLEIVAAAEVVFTVVTVTVTVADDDNVLSRPRHQLLRIRPWPSVAKKPLVAEISFQKRGQHENKQYQTTRCLDRDGRRCRRHG